MPPPRERRWPRLVAGYAMLVTLVAGGSVPLYFLLAPANRPLLIRLAASLILAVVATHLAKTLRARIDAQAPSAFEGALEAERPQPRLDRRFVEIRDELRYGASSQSYFDRVLWPELVALAGQASSGAPGDRVIKPAGRLFRRGPSLTALRDLIRAIEEARR